MFLGLLSFTGVLGVLLFSTLYILSIINLNKNRNYDVSKLITIVLFCFLLNSITMEFYLQPMMAMYLGYITRSLIRETKVK